MPKLTEKQKTKRAAAIEMGFFAIERVLALNRLRAHMHANNLKRCDEVEALTNTAAEHAATLILDTFGGTIDGKKYWPPKKRKTRCRAS